MGSDQLIMVSGGWWLLQIAILLAAQHVIRAQGQDGEGEDGKKETIIGQQIEDGNSSSMTRDSEEKDNEVEKDPSDMMGENKPSKEDGDKEPLEEDGEKEPSDKDGDKEPIEDDGEKEPLNKDEEKESSDKEGNKSLDMDEREEPSDKTVRKEEELSEEEIMGMMPMPKCFEMDKAYIGYPMNTSDGDRYIKDCPNPQHCQVMCQRRKGCEWFNWSNGTCPRTGNVISRCWMKKGKGNGMFKAGGITGPKSCKQEKKRSCIENNMMYIGDGLNVWKRRGNNFGRQKTAARCQDLCKRTRGCKWFNWNSKSQCWLKRSHGQRFAANVRPENGTSTGPRECPIIPAEHRCDEGWRYFQGKCYLVNVKMDRFKLDFNDVKQICKKKGASLVSFQSKQEFNFVTDIMDRNHWQQTGVQFWIGAKRVGEEKAFIWEEDNSPLNLTWDAYDKDNDDSPSAYKCLELLRDKFNKWVYHPDECEEKDHDGSYICEKPADIVSKISATTPETETPEEATTEAVTEEGSGESSPDEGSGYNPPFGCIDKYVDYGLLECSGYHSHCILRCLPGYSAFPHHHYKCTGGPHLQNSDGEVVRMDEVKCSPSQAVVGGCSVTNNQTIIQIANKEETCSIAPLPGEGVCHYDYTLNYLDGMLLACGGTPNPGKCLEYDPDNNVWIDAATLQVDRMGSASVVIDNEMYIIGGYGSNNTIEIISFNPDTMTYDSSLETERFPYEVTCKDCMVLSDSDTILTLTSRDEHFFSYNITSGNATDLAVPFKRSLKVPCVFFMNQDTQSLMVENVIDNMDDIELAGYVYNIETGTWVKDSQASYATGHLLNIDGGDIVRISLKAETDGGRAFLYKPGNKQGDTSQWEMYGSTMTLAQSSVHGPATTIPSDLISCMK